MASHINSVYSEVATEGIDSLNTLHLCLSKWGKTVIAGSLGLGDVEGK